MLLRFVWLHFYTVTLPHLALAILSGGFFLCFLYICLYGVPASEYVFLFFLVFFFLSIPYYFSDYCVVFHYVVPLEAKVCLFCWWHEWLVALIALEEHFYGVRIVLIICCNKGSYALLYYLMPLSHEVNWMGDTFLDMLCCWCLFFLTTINDLALLCK